MKRAVIFLCCFGLLGAIAFYSPKYLFNEKKFEETELQQKKLYEQ